MKPTIWWVEIDSKESDTHPHTHFITDVLYIQPTSKQTNQTKQTNTENLANSGYNCIVIKILSHQLAIWHSNSTGNSKCIRYYDQITKSWCKFTFGSMESPATAITFVQCKVEHFWISSCFSGIYQIIIYYIN